MKKQSIQMKMHGFTLLEMLFALIIFSFALVSLMGIAGKGVVATVNAKENLTAQYLAEEILEVARNIRDSSRKSLNADNMTETWNSLLDECENGCEISNNIALAPCPTSGECGDVSNENLANYSQKIFITSDSTTTPHDYLKLKAVVEWNQRRVPRTYTLVTYLNP